MGTFWGCYVVQCLHKGPFPPTLCKGWGMDTSIACRDALSVVAPTLGTCSSTLIYVPVPTLNTLVSPLGYPGTCDCVYKYGSCGNAREASRAVQRCGELRLLFWSGRVCKLVRVVHLPLLVFLGESSLCVSGGSALHGGRDDSSLGNAH